MKPFQLSFPIAFVLAWLLATSGGLRADVLDYYANEIDAPDHVLAKLAQAQALLADESLEDAIVIAEDLISANQALETDNPMAFSKLMSNLGVLLIHGEYYDNAIDALDKSIVLMDSNAPPFSDELFNTLMTRALALMNLNRLDDAEESLLRAQNIKHRQHGVYTREQLPVIQQLFQINYRKGNIKDADTQQFFTLRVSEQAYGADSEELIPVLVRLGHYFTNRGNRAPIGSDGQYRAERELLFRHARDQFERAIKIVETTYGPDDLRLVEPLQGLARMRYIQRVGTRRAEEALERALRVIEANPSTDLPERIRSMVGLADLYNLTGDERAAPLYLKAWRILDEDDEYQNLKAEYFGTPVRLEPLPRVYYLSRLPDGVASPDVELFIDAEYTVRANGRVANIELINKNVPNEQLRLLRSQLYNVQFRPRIVAGEFVDTENLFLHQSFRVARRTVEPDSRQSGSQY
jgi:tetratricopeptide (TPR) repeat protein